MTGQEAPVELARQRLQRLTATLVVAVLPWLIGPGTLQPDTKTALVLAPARYLQRALWAWNDHTGIGELQNQAYGYLWPMGPFFLAGDLAGLPAWVVQRGWWTLLLVLAFLGAERLARRVAGIAPVPALLAGAVFALSPRVLTVLAEISIEVWPYALAPWLVLAADRAVRPGARAVDRRRAAVTTGLLTACLGGVNATVSLVALVPAALWVLTAPRGRAGGRALAWWLLGALLGGLWWLGPLVVLGGYAYPFLDHIELASTTTAVASVTNVLRGADHWIAYILTDGEHPTWQSGWVLAQSVTAILATCALAGLGLAGLLRRRAAERQVADADGMEEDADDVEETDSRWLTRWSLVLVLLGVVTMAVGRSGAASGPFAPTVQGWLDGPLAPLRNVHKADLLVRLPIALGAGMLAHWATRTTRGPGPVVRQLVVTGLVLALVGSLAPVWLGRVGDAWATKGVPPAWHEMADRVDTAAARDGGTTLVLPGARTADFTWGRTTDEPLTALASSPVLVRAAAPLGHPGATRILDHVDELVATGRSQPELADQLQRLGISRVVVRGGLSPDVGAGDSTAAAATLAHSRGLTRAWSTGSGSQRLSLWRVDRPAEPATLVPREGVVPVAAAPEGWSTMVATGVLDPDAVTVLAGGREAQVRTDSLRWQALNSGRPSQRAHGPTLPADDDRPAVVGTKDFAPGGERTARTTRVWRGLAGLDVTSSGADPFARHWHGAGSGPASLVDDDGTTAWVSGDGEATQHITLLLDGAARPSAALVHEALGEGLGRITDVRSGRTHGHRIKGTATWRLPLDEVRRRVVTIEVQGKAGKSGDDAPPIGVRQIDLVDGPNLGTALSVPKGDGAVVIRRDPRGDADLTKGEDPADLVRAVGPTERSSISARVRLQPGEAAQDLLAAPWSLQGSTEPAPEDAGRDMEQWPVAALDDDPGTAWRPQTGVERPVLAIDLGAPEEVGRIELDRAAGPVTVETDHGRHVVPSGRTIEVPGPATRHLELTFTRPSGRADWTVPDISLPGVEGPGGRVHLDCGEAGQVTRDEGAVDLALAADRGDLAAGEAVSATACGELPGGSGDVTARSVPGLVPQTVVLRPEGWSATEVESRPVGSRRHHAGSWTFEVDAQEKSLLVLDQGANDGWVATTEDGRTLERVTVDGWRQAFVVPAGTSGEVDVDFAPGRWHQGALAAGAAAVLLLLLWAAGGWLLRRRRHREELPDEQGPSAAAEEAPAEESAPDQAGERGRGVRFVLGCALAAVAGVLVAGWTGVVAAVVGALVPGRWRAPFVAVVLTGAGIALTVLGTADRQSAGAWVSQGLGALTLGLLAAALVRPGRGGRGPAADAPRESTTGDPDPDSAP